MKLEFIYEVHLFNGIKWVNFPCTESNLEKTLKGLFINNLLKEVWIVRLGKMTDNGEIK